MSNIHDSYFVVYLSTENGLLALWQITMVKENGILPLGTTIGKRANWPDGMFRLSRPMFYKYNDYVTADHFAALSMHITRCLLGHGLLCAIHIRELHLENLALLLRHSSSIGSAMRAEYTVCLLLGCCIGQRIPLWLLGQPGGGSVVLVMLGCCQERINMSTVPKALESSFQPLSSSLATLGSSELWTQWNTVRQLAVSTGSAIHIVKDLEIWFLREIYVVLIVTYYWR